MSWIGTELPGAIRDRSKLKGHGVDLVYGFFALSYIVLVKYFMLIV